MASSRSDWKNEARNVLRALIARSGVTYEQLAERLKKQGVSETVSSIKGKIHRGSFGFTFVLQVMAALDKDKLDLN